MNQPLRTFFLEAGGGGGGVDGERKRQRRREEGRNHRPRVISPSGRKNTLLVWSLI